MNPTIYPISKTRSLLLFGIPTIVFLVICRGLVPLLNQNYGFHPALSWFMGGLLIFLPLFLLVIVGVKKDGFRIKAEIFNRLRLRKLSKRDWKYALLSTLIILMLTGLIMGISRFLHVRFGIPEIETTPSFLKFEPFQGSERFLLLAWLVMFFFNILGEEMMWRGYILPRQELNLGSNAWFFNALLWLMFHICFGLQLIILLIPILFILPYAVQRTQNTSVGIYIHALVNGPAFVMVSLGIIG